MATERVYHPETCEPFDVPAAKAGKLVLEHGWSRTPWTRVEVPSAVEGEGEGEVEAEAAETLLVAPDEDEAPRPRGRGRQRRTVEAEPETTDVADVDDGDWRG